MFFFSFSRAEGLVLEWRVSYHYIGCDGQVSTQFWPYSVCSNVLKRFHSGHLTSQLCNELTKKAVYLQLTHEKWQMHFPQNFGGWDVGVAQVHPSLPLQLPRIYTWKIILNRNRASLVSTATRGFIPRDCAVNHLNTEPRDHFLFPTRM